MTLKEIKEHYTVYGKYSNEYPYLLYTKDIATDCRSVHRYLCSIKKKNQRFAVVGTDKYVNNINDLSIEIKKHTNSLEYDSDYYNPMYREGYFEEMIIHDYLADRGFKSSNRYLNTISYEYAPRNIYDGKLTNIYLSFHGLESMKEIKDNVTILLSITNFSWVRHECKRNVRDIINGIESLLKPLLLDGSIKLYNKSKEFDDTKFLADIKLLDPNTLETKSFTYREDLKLALQGLLEKL